MILLTCPGCDKKLKVQDSRAGKLVQCPGCKTRMRVPAGQKTDPADQAAKTRSMTSAARTTRPESAITSGAPLSRRRAVGDARNRADKREEFDEVEREDRDEERPRKRRKKRRKTEYSPMPVLLVSLGLAAGLYGVLVLWAVFGRGGALALLIAGAALFICARIWFIYLARQEDVVVYLLVRFVPFYSIYYFFTRIGETFKPFILGSVGGTFALTGLMIMLLRGDFRSHFDERFDNRVQVQRFVPPGPGQPGNAAVQVPAGKHNVLIKKDDQLTANDPADKVLNQCRHKTYSVMFKAGRTYVIDLVSNDFDAFLRLEDPEGKQVAQDDDGGEDLNARIVFSPQRDGMYRVITTSLEPAVGRYTLTVQELEQPGKGQK